MSRKKRKANKAKSGYDSHHILFYRREWSKGFKQLLRRSFVYEIPIEVHQELHAMIAQVPPLEEYQAEFLWRRYKELGRELDLFEAYEWLILNSPNIEFGTSIMAQYGFLRNKMG